MSASDREKEDAADSLTPSERRLGYRYLSCFPAYLERQEGGKRAAMIHDLSVSGALLLVRSKLDIGDTVRLKLFFNGDMESGREAVARVVRVERLSDPFAGPWSDRVAVQFDEELLGVDGEIEALAKKQAEFFAPKPNAKV
jgi:hypothetical protein